MNLLYTLTVLDSQMHNKINQSEISELVVHSQMHQFMKLLLCFNGCNYEKLGLRQWHVCGVQSDEKQTNDERTLSRIKIVVNILVTAGAKKELLHCHWSQPKNSDW
jgi:hypothetical protein